MYKSSEHVGSHFTLPTHSVTQICHSKNSAKKSNSYHWIQMRTHAFADMSTIRMLGNRAPSYRWTNIQIQYSTFEHSVDFFKHSIFNNSAEVTVHAPLLCCISQSFPDHIQPSFHQMSSSFNEKRL